MGDMAAGRGDYLFAKYCWDRVVEIDPNIPNIYRKLGLMTAEHLQDYRETAAIYLRKALEINANDPEVKAALGEVADSGEQESVAVLPAPGSRTSKGSNSTSVQNSTSNRFFNSTKRSTRLPVRMSL